MRLGNIAVRALKTLLFALAFIGAVLAAAECWYQINPKKALIDLGPIKNRLWDAWLNKNNTDPLLPPFKVFSNTGMDDRVRLRFIARETALPKNTRLTSHDFLQAEERKNETRYTATINNFGFRDPPRSAQKAKNVYRIIVLGSYQAFGHGVEDESTYPRQLERFLNSSKTVPLTFEVWNGGKHAGSAIVGLARLETDLFTYSPDLIIWDYGFVDSFILGDNFLLQVLQLPDTGLYRLLGWFVTWSKDIFLSKSRLFVQFQNYWILKHMKDNLADFWKVNERMVLLASDRGIPVILLRHSIVLMPTFLHYREFANDKKGLYVVNGEAIFARYPPSPELTRQFLSGPNWVTEYGRSRDYLWPYSEYFKSVYQYNEKGYEATARYLADTVKDILDKAGQKPLM